MNILKNTAACAAVAAITITEVTASAYRGSGVDGNNRKCYIRLVILPAMIRAISLL